MMATNKIPVFALTFGVAYEAIYTVCTEINLPLLTYHPVIGEMDFLWQPPRRGPAMYWYGWMLTSAIGAVVLGWIGMTIPEQWLQRAILFGCLAAAAYLLLYTVALFIYDKATVELEFLKSRWLSAIAAAVVAAVISCFAPAHWNRRLWPGWMWVVPIGSLAVLGYYLTPYFTQ
jgi:hypothetical protein